VYFLVRGTRKSPGVLLLGLGLLLRTPYTGTRFLVTMRAYRDAWSAAGKSR